MTTDAPKLPAPPVVGARRPDSDPSRAATDPPSLLDEGGRPLELATTAPALTGLSCFRTDRPEAFVEACAKARENQSPSR